MVSVPTFRPFFLVIVVLNFFYFLNSESIMVKNLPAMQETQV